MQRDVLRRLVRQRSARVGLALIGVAGGHPLAYWYTFVFPAVAIFPFVLAWNLLGDAIRNAGDPRLAAAQGDGDGR